MDNSQARAANRQQVADFVASGKAASSFAGNVDKANKRATASTAAAAKSQFGSVEKVAAAHTNLIDKVAKRQQRASDVATKYSQRSADAEIRNAERAAAAAGKKLDRTMQAAQKVADAQQRRFDRAAAAAKREEDREAKSDQRKLDSATKASQKQTDAETRAAQRKAAMIDRIESKFVADDLKRRMKSDMAKQASAAKEIALAQKVAMKRTEAAIRAGKVERGRVEGAAAANSDLIEKVGGVAAAYLTIAVAVGTLKKIVDITNEAAEAASNHAKETLKVRDALRELAAMKGKSGPTDEDVKKYAGMRNSSGLSHEEAITYGSELFNALGTVPEQKLSSTEREQLAVGGAKMTSRLGGGESGAKARAGIQGLLPNYLQGDNGKPLTAKKVLAYADKAETLTGLGFFNQVQGAEQYQKLLTSMTSEKLVGASHNPLEAAALGAVASKFGAGEAAENSMRAIRGVSSLTKMTQGKGAEEAQAEALKEWGVKEDMSPIQRMQQVFKALDKNAKGRNIQTYLQEHGFRNQTEAEAIGKFYEQHQNGTFDEFLGKAQEPVDEAAPETKFKKFAASKVGRARLAEAHRDTAIVEAGIPQENLNIARTEGEAEAIRTGADQKFATKAGLFLKGLTMFSQQAALDSFHEDLGMQKGRKELGMAPPKMDPAMMAASAIPIIGPFLPSNINHWTGYNQAEADRIDGERGAQAQGLMGGQAPGAVPPVFGQMLGAMNAMNQKLAQMVKPPLPAPKPQGKPPGQPRRP